MGNYKAKLKLVIRSEKTNFYGPGINELLLLINEKGSTKDAANTMGLSYSRALKIIKRCEKELGYGIVKTQRGGTDGGKSIVTEEGLRLMRAYKDFNDEINKNLDEQYHKYFPFLEE